jgi:hypothetical protein
MQQPAPQTNGQTQPTLNLTDLSIDELNIIIMGLVKLPYETSAPVVEKVRTQASAQIQQLQSAQQPGTTIRPDGINVNAK